MENRYYYDEFAEDIFDSQIDDYPANHTICKELNDQNNRIKELEQQLAVKDKEIDALNKTIFRIENEKANIIQKEMIDYLSFAKQIRKQVCDEIREKCEIFGAGPIGKLGYIIRNELLDQIEKGEIK